MTPIHQLIKQTLETHGYTVTSFTNPPNAKTTLTISTNHPRQKGWQINIGHIWLNQHPQPIHLYRLAQENHQYNQTEINQSDPQLLQKITQFYGPARHP